MIWPHIILILFNVVNALIDAYRIDNEKRIYHGINGAAYLITVAVSAFLFLPAAYIGTFLISAPFHRLTVFNPLLNIFRGLDYGYRSKEPKAIWDQIEQNISYNGRLLTVIYSIILIIILTVYFLL